MQSMVLCDQHSPEGTSRTMLINVLAKESSAARESRKSILHLSVKMTGVQIVFFAIGPCKEKS